MRMCALFQFTHSSSGDTEREQIDWPNRTEPNAGNSHRNCTISMEMFPCIYALHLQCGDGCSVIVVPMCNNKVENCHWQTLELQKSEEKWKTQWQRVNHREKKTSFLWSCKSNTTNIAVNKASIFTRQPYYATAIKTQIAT